MKTRSGDKYSCKATDTSTVTKPYPLYQLVEKQAYRLCNKNKSKNPNNEQLRIKTHKIK